MQAVPYFVLLFHVAFVVANVEVKSFPGSVLPVESKDIAEGPGELPSVQDDDEEENEMDDLGSRMKQLMLEFHGMCPVKHGDYCFFGVFVGPSQVNHQAAKLLCKQRRAKLGNIYSESHYDQVMHYLRPWIASRPNGGTEIGIRTGMPFSTRAGVVYLTSGTRAPFVRWKTGFPRTNNDVASTTVLSVSRVGSPGNGMANNKPSDAGFGVLCQVSIK